VHVWGLSRAEFSSLPSSESMWSGQQREQRVSNLYLINHVDPVLRAHYKLEGKEGRQKDSLYNAKKLHRTVSEVQAIREKKAGKEK
jgi:hypothetical protein